MHHHGLLLHHHWPLILLLHHRLLHHHRLTHHLSLLHHLLLLYHSLLLCHHSSSLSLLLLHHHLLLRHWVWCCCYRCKSWLRSSEHWGAHCLISCGGCCGRGCMSYACSRRCYNWCGHWHYWRRCYHWGCHHWRPHHSVLIALSVHCLHSISHHLLLTHSHHLLLLLDCNIVHIGMICHWLLCTEELLLHNLLSSHILLCICLHLSKSRLFTYFFFLTFEELNLIMITSFFSLFDLYFDPSFSTSFLS